MGLWTRPAVLLFMRGALLFVGEGGGEGEEGGEGAPGEGEELGEIKRGPWIGGCSWGVLLNLVGRLANR